MSSSHWGRWSIIAGLLFLTGCEKRLSDILDPDDGEDSATPKKYLYVASGTCYGGGVTLSTGSNTIAKYDLDARTLVRVSVDYATSPGDSPQGLADWDDDYIIAAIHNAGSKRVDLVKKGGTDETVSFLTNSALTGTIRSILPLSDGGLLINEAVDFEKFTSTKNRITQGANAFINAPAAPCATSTTQMTDVVELSNGKLIYTHGAASPNNRIGMIAAAGYSAAPDCLTSLAGPVATALPTALVMAEEDKALVAYGSTTAGSNFIYSYDVDGTGNTISNPAVAYSDSNIVNGPSAMVFDDDANALYVANATSTLNTIEKFTYDPNTALLTRASTTEWIPRSVFTRCVSGMVITEE